MRSLKIIILMSAAALVGITAGCGWDSATGPRQHRPDWDSVRYQTGDPEAESSLELTVLPDGRLSMTETRGDEVSVRGLLAGGNLETLARLLDSLPPSSYTSDVPCADDDGFVVTVTRPGGVSTYSSNRCDADTPEALQELRRLFDEFNDLVVAPRARLVPFQILAEGLESDISLESTVIVHNRDALIDLLRRHRANGSVAVPRVDFARQFVVGEFMGEQRGSVHAVTADGAELTEGGWLRVLLRRVEPVEGCPVDGMAVRPFVLVAVERSSSDLLLQTEVTQVPCRSGD